MNSFILKIKEQSLDNKYTKWYTAIIENAIQRTTRNKTLNFQRNQAKALLGYTEGHHIFPSCMCSTSERNNKENFAFLTAKEHFVVHLLLSKMFENKKKAQMQFALLGLTMINKNQTNQRSINSTMYNYLKRCNSEASTVRNATRIYVRKVKLPPHTQETKDKIGKLNKGRKYYHNKDGKVIALQKDDPIPEGFIKGNPNAKTRSTQNTKMYNNKIVNKRFKPGELIGDEWQAGSMLIWVTNGVIRKQVNRYLDIPEGFTKGAPKRKPVGIYNWKIEDTEGNITIIQKEDLFEYKKTNNLCNPIFRDNVARYKGLKITRFS